MPSDKRLYQYLSEWSAWHTGGNKTPEVIQTLHHGISNDSYLVSCQDKQYVLRIHNTNPAFQVNRHQEKIIQSEVNRLGLAPAILFQRSDNAYRITEYIEGSPLVESDIPRDQQLALLSTAIQQYQNLQLDLPAISYTKQIEHYWTLATQKNKHLSVTEAEVTQILDICQLYETAGQNKRVLCHHDLNSHNVLVGFGQQQQPRLILLDWEYAALGIASMDFATLTVELDADITALSHHSGIALNELQEAACIYRFMCKLYQLAS